MAPAALGAMLARLLGEPLIVVTAYPINLAVESLLPEYSDALAREVLKAADRVAQQVDGARIRVADSSDGETHEGPARAARAEG